MTMAIAWLVFPLVLVLLSLGSGLLLQRAAAIDLPAPLLIPAGFVVVSLAAQFAHMSDSTAGLGTALVVALAVGGYALTFSWRRPTWPRPRVDPWWIAAGVGVFAVFAAPVVLSGRATFAGFIKLDDTANYLAMIARSTHHGYNVSGLAPSTYETFLSMIYAVGYPLGSVLPLGVGSALVGRDAAWLWQPYLTFLAAMIGLGLYQLVSGLVRSRWLRALVAFIGAQAALIYGYALWGGIKELATTVVVVLIAALVPTAVERGETRALLPIAAASAALVGILTVGGAAWLAPLLLGALLLAARTTGLRIAARSSLAFAVSAGVLAIPAFVAAVTWLEHSGIYTSEGEYANLRGRLSWLQVFGIWLEGDFRTRPRNVDVTYALVAVVAIAFIFALGFAWRRRTWELLLASATAAFACVFYVEGASPWIGAKALASASPIILAVAVAGAAVLFEGGRRVEAVVVAGFIVVGVIWSNALQYHLVYLAPSSRLSELATIGHRFAGEGPTLLTEYEEYGSRYFLRSMAAEAPSELRRHYIYLRAGGFFQPSDKGTTPDIDEIRLDSVLDYRTLVTRRSGVGSRPPSAYKLVWTGRYYQVWQRPNGHSPILDHLSLGSRVQPAAVPNCSAVLRLARLAKANAGMLATVERPPAIVLEPSGTIGAPTSFGPAGTDPATVYLTKAATLNLSFSVPSSGNYDVWVGGSFRSRLKVFVDGSQVGSDRDQLNWPLNFTDLGQARLSAGNHVLTVRYTGPDLLPGSAGDSVSSTGKLASGLGPLAIAQGTNERPVTYVRPSNARSLCRNTLDWVEALRD
jgi:hypothetical protein